MLRFLWCFRKQGWKGQTVAVISGLGSSGDVSHCSCLRGGDPCMQICGCPITSEKDERRSFDELLDLYMFLIYLFD